MRAVIQAVSSASVRVNGGEPRSIGNIFPISAQFVRGTISIHPERPVWNTTL